MDVNTMREYISNAYPGRSWKTRCNIMPPQQVIAIYHSLVSREKKPERPKLQMSKGNYQITIFDMLKEGE